MTISTFALMLTMALITGMAPALCCLLTAILATRWHNNHPDGDDSAQRWQQAIALDRRTRLQIALHAVENDMLAYQSGKEKS